MWPVIDGGDCYLFRLLSSPSFSLPLPPLSLRLTLSFSSVTPHVLPLLSPPLKSCLCSLLLRNANADYSILERLRPSGNNLTSKLPTLCEERGHQTDSLNKKSRKHARSLLHAQEKHLLLTRWSLQWPCARLGDGSWLRWSSVCHVCPPGIPRCRHSHSPPATQHGTDSNFISAHKYSREKRWLKHRRGARSS